jgi:predicted enzyme related to lactoylglutathione lyase
MGNPFVHLDLSTDDVAGAKKFYKSVFDWSFKDFPQMDWSGIDVGKGVGGGIGKKQMPTQPTAWTAYVDVNDVKKTIAKAKKAGATIIVPHMEVPNMGYLGVFVDPQGATIGVWQAIKKAAAPARKKTAAKKPATARRAPGKKAAKRRRAA